MESPSNRRSMPLGEARQVILGWDSTEEMIFQGEREEIERYLLAVDVIRQNRGGSGGLDTVVQVAMARLEAEFRSLLVAHASSSSSDFDSDSLAGNESVTPRVSIFGEDQDAGDDEGSVHVEISLGLKDSEDSTVSRHRRRSSSGCSLRELDLVPSETADRLRSIAETMATFGLSTASGRAYSGARLTAIESTLKSLGIEKLTIGDVKNIEGHALERKIRRWIRAARVCFRVLFPAEKRLSDQVFAGIGSTEDAFSETVKPSALHLLSFAEAIGVGSHKSPERLFKVVDLHDCLTDLIPDIDLVFEWDPVKIVPAKAAETMVRLGEAARAILLEFQTAVLQEPSRTPVPGGTVHPLTRYVMNYLALISDYKETLTELVVLRPLTEDPTLPEVDLGEFEGKTPLELHLIWTIVILQSNLEGKSKHYSDPSLGHLFIMNNIHYIVKKATASSPELNRMIGDSYLRRLTAKYRRAATGYHRSTWVRVLYCLRDEGLHSSGSFSYSGVLRNVLKERFKGFNAMFDEVHRVQATWHVPDPQLKEELQILISEHLIPAYRSFLGRYRGHIERERHPENYIKYSVENLETALLDFFEGPKSSYHSRRKSG